MLTLRPNCEHCGKDLPYNATDAMICSFECTFCQHCVENVLKNVCPNCSGGFTSRPIRPAVSLEKYPASLERIHQPVDSALHQKRIEKFAHIPPKQR